MLGIEAHGTRRVRVLKGPINDVNECEMVGNNANGPYVLDADPNPASDRPFVAVVGRGEPEMHPPTASTSRQMQVQNHRDAGCATEHSTMPNRAQHTTTIEAIH